MTYKKTDIPNMSISVFKVLTAILNPSYKTKVLSMR